MNQSTPPSGIIKHLFKSNIFRLLIIHSAFLVALVSSWAQGPSAQNIWIEKIQHKQHVSMTVLGTWAVVNIGGGLILAERYSDHRKHFHHMNAAWNTVNLGLSIGGLISANRIKRKYLTNESLAAYNSRMKELLMFNAGLDLAYIATGFYLKERSKNATDNADRLKGFGSSLILQGAFLFLFDLTYYFSLPNANIILGSTSLGGSPGLSFKWYFN